MPRLIKLLNRWKPLLITTVFFVAVVALALTLYLHGMLNGGP